MMLPGYLQDASYQYRLEKARLLARVQAQIGSWLQNPLHINQQKIMDSSARFRVVACGRRFGKTELGKRYGVLRAQRGFYVWWVSPTHKMALDVWNALMGETAEVRSELRRVDREIVFPSGGRLRVVSAHDPQKLRGAGLDDVIIDEAAYCSESAWHVLRPALSDKKGNGLFLSSPRGRNWFWHLYQMGLDPLVPEFSSWHMPSLSNPRLDPAEIETAKRTMPDRQYRQEYLAEFLDDYGTVFRGVYEVSTGQPEAPKPDSRYVFGVDWGRVNDFSVISVWDSVRRKEVFIDRFNEIGWTAQRNRLKVLAKRFRPYLILAEANSIGEPNIEALQMEGLPVQPFTMTAHNKGPLVDALALAMEERSCELLNDEIANGEMSSFEMERLTSGVWRYSAPEGGHDDIVVARLLGYQATGLHINIEKPPDWLKEWMDGNGN